MRNRGFRKWFQSPVNFYLNGIFFVGAFVVVILVIILISGGNVGEIERLRSDNRALATNASQNATKLAGLQYAVSPTSTISNQAKPASNATPISLGSNPSEVKGHSRLKILLPDGNIIYTDRMTFGDGMQVHSHMVQKEDGTFVGSVFLELPPVYGASCDAGRFVDIGIHIYPEKFSHENVYCYVTPKEPMIKSTTAYLRVAQKQVFDVDFVVALNEDQMPREFHLEVERDGTNSITGDKNTDLNGKSVTVKVRGKIVEYLIK